MARWKRISRELGPAIQKIWLFPKKRMHPRIPQARSIGASRQFKEIGRKIFIFLKLAIPVLTSTSSSEKKKKRKNDRTKRRESRLQKISITLSSAVV